MARILYGIHGTGHGHAMRGLTIARALPHHEFLFVANDDAPEVLEPEFNTVRLPNIGTSFKDYQVDLKKTIKKGLGILIDKKRHMGDAQKIVDRFKPDVCMSDLEYFVPRVAKLNGIPCLTLDHQHVLTCCAHDLPYSMLWDVFFQGLTPRYLFRPTEANLVISFYQPATLPRYNVRIAPPILRKKVINLQPEDKGHVLVYQSNTTDSRLIEFLKNHVDREVYVFGYPRHEERENNIVFMEKSEDRFLELLSTAAYVIQGGSHTLMSEALYLEKPIISLPIQAMVEQRLNAHYLEKLGYGRNLRMNELSSDIIKNFENNLASYKNRIRQNNFYGNEIVFSLVDQFIKSGDPAVINSHV